MPHELDITNGVASFANSRSDAWHRLGQSVGHTMTALEALDAAHNAIGDVEFVGHDSEPFVRGLAGDVGATRSCLPSGIEINNRQQGRESSRGPAQCFPASAASGWENVASRRP